MLGHHLDVLEASQEPLKTALQGCHAHDEAAVGTDADIARTQAVAAAVEQAMNQVVLEAGAMRSTLHVMSAWIPLLQPEPASTNSQAAKDSAAAPGRLESAQDGGWNGPNKGGQAKDESTNSATVATPADAAVIAELKAKAEKWKMRCQELKREMAVAAAASAAREAAAAERLAEAQALHHPIKPRQVHRPVHDATCISSHSDSCKLESRLLSCCRCTMCMP